MAPDFLNFLICNMLQDFIRKGTSGLLFFAIVRFLPTSQETKAVKRKAKAKNIRRICKSRPSIFWLRPSAKPEAASGSSVINLKKQSQFRDSYRTPRNLVCTRVYLQEAVRINLLIHQHFGGGYDVHQVPIEDIDNSRIQAAGDSHSKKYTVYETSFGRSL
jgi:hypothetical protein